MKEVPLFRYATEVSCHTWPMNICPILNQHCLGCCAPDIHQGDKFSEALYK